MSYRRPWPTDVVVSDDDYCEKCCGVCTSIPPHERDDEPTLSTDTSVAEKSALSTSCLNKSSLHPPEDLVKTLENLLRCGNGIIGADKDDPNAADAYEMYDDARTQARAALSTYPSSSSRDESFCETSLNTSSLPQIPSIDARVKELETALAELLRCGNAIVGANIDDPNSADAFDMYQEARMQARSALSQGSPGQ